MAVLGPWMVEMVSTFPEQPLNVIWQNLTRSKYEVTLSSTIFSFFSGPYLKVADGILIGNIFVVIGLYADGHPRLELLIMCRAYFIYYLCTASSSTLLHMTSVYRESNQDIPMCLWMYMTKHRSDGTMK